MLLWAASCGSDACTADHCYDSTCMNIYIYIYVDLCIYIYIYVCIICVFAFSLYVGFMMAFGLTQSPQLAGSE